MNRLRVIGMTIRIPLPVIKCRETWNIENHVIVSDSISAPKTVMATSNT